MKIKRIDHIGINVVDLAAAKAFFLDLGFTVKGEWDMSGTLLETVVALPHAKTSVVMLGFPGGNIDVELATYHEPANREIPETLANTPGIRHICIAVEDLDSYIAKLKEKNVAFFSDVQHYENTYKLVYVRGPEGIILEFAEKIS